MDKYLIEKAQNYTLDRKILSIDSDDRDIKKYPNINTFEISCPQDYNNIESIRLLSIKIPNNLYNISNYLKNNYFYLTINGNQHKIIIEDGYYDEILLSTYINNYLKLIDNNFNIKYNNVNKKIYFGNTNTSFSLNFNNYSNKLNNILGFNNITYNSFINESSYNIYFFHETNPWITLDDSGSPEQIKLNSNLLISPNTININQNDNIYLEIDKLNSSDEIKPYIINTNSNTNSGIVNSYFAKIPIILSQYNQSFSSKDCFLESVSYFQPPLEKLSKLKFKFRYHDGTLVEFNNNNISFVLEINQIRNEIKNYDVRTPYVL